MKRFRMIAAAVAVAMAAGPSARAELVHLIHSFEGPDLNVPRSFNYENGGLVPGGGGLSNSVGVTDGTQALALDHTAVQANDGARLAFQVGLTLEDIEALKVTRTIKWDVTSAADPDPSDGVTGFGTWFSWNTNLTGFVSSTTFPSNFNTFFTNFIPYGSDGPGATTTASVTLEPIVISAMENSLTGAITGSPGFVLLHLGHLFLNDNLSQPVPRVYVDYVRILVPEPASAGLVAAAIAAAAAGRRR